MFGSAFARSSDTLASAIDCTDGTLLIPGSAPMWRSRAKKLKTDIRHWQSVLREAERELEAATGRTALSAAAKKLMRARAELKRLKTRGSRLI